MVLELAHLYHFSPVLLIPADNAYEANLVRAGFIPRSLMGNEIFQAILDHPEGMFIGSLDPEDNFSMLKTEDGRINIWIPDR